MSPDAAPPIFDSLTHPTLSGGWIDGRREAGFAELDRALGAASFLGACAVGLAGVGGYHHEAFAAECARWPRLVPIAGVDPKAGARLAGELDVVRDLGYAGIKLHPRLSEWEPDAGALGEVLGLAAERGLVTFYCTYLHAPAARHPASDPYYVLVGALKQAPDARVVLAHGGGVDLLRHAELVRHNENLLLDLSFTLLKYRGSSIDADAAWLFEQFDRRVCVGSDHPEFAPLELRRHLDRALATLPRDKAENVAHRNLARFLGRAPRPIPDLEDA